MSLKKLLIRITFSFTMLLFSSNTFAYFINGHYAHLDRCTLSGFGYVGIYSTFDRTYVLYFDSYCPF
ncbi:MAG: hypothetical protein VX335_02085 [Pseudomonadota bacterium]|nr:hypothetical protein [Pseudomonadota bacterium]